MERDKDCFLRDLPNLCLKYCLIHSSVVCCKDWIYACSCSDFEAGFLFLWSEASPIGHIGARRNTYPIAIRFLLLTDNCSRTTLSSCCHDCNSIPSRSSVTHLVNFYRWGIGLERFCYLNKGLSTHLGRFHELLWKLTLFRTNTKQIRRTFIKRNLIKQRFL